MEWFFCVQKDITRENVYAFQAKGDVHHNTGSIATPLS